MNLPEILSLHKLWLDTNGSTGVRANFSPKGKPQFWTHDNRLVILGQEPSFALRDVIHPKERDIFTGCDLRKACFDDVDISNISFVGCSLEGASFIGAKIFKVRFDNSNLSRCDLSSVRGRMVSFQGANLSHAKINFAQLPQSNLEGSILEHSVIKDSNLIRSSMHNVRASYVTIEHTNLTKVDLSNSDFTNANIVKSILSNAVVSETIFDDANVFASKLLNISGEYMSAQRSILTCANLSASKLSYAKFNDSNLRGTVFDNVHIVNSTFDRVDFREHTWEEPEYHKEVIKSHVVYTTKYIIKHRLPSVKGSVFINCTFYDAWIDTSLIPYLTKSIARSTIHVKGDRMYNKIFIAHASEDLNIALELYRKLVSQGFNPWIDSLDLKVGEQWERVIPKIINSAKAIIICLSKLSVSKRGYIQKEFRLALDTLKTIPLGEIFILPVRLENCDVPPEFQEFHWVDYWEPDSLPRIVYALTELQKGQ